MSDSVKNKKSMFVLYFIEIKNNISNRTGVDKQLTFFLNSFKCRKPNLIEMHYFWVASWQII